MNRIEAEGLTRDFNAKRAVDHISFSVQAGEIFGFLGPNGAGKTTTIRMLTGQLQPTEGTARIMGFDIVREHSSIKPQIGVVFEYQNFYAHLSARENLNFFADLYGAPRKRVQTTLEQVGLAIRDNERIKNFSNGMKQRLLIACALLHEPKVIFLDEPTRGLDPGAARNIRELILTLSAQGISIFLTTHYMEEADQLCDRVAILDRGRIAALDRPDHLKTICNVSSLEDAFMKLTGNSLLGNNIF